VIRFVNPTSGLEIIRTPFRAPQANGVAERFVRTVRSECLDWLLILNDQHLERVLDVFVEHYNGHRPHRALALTPPRPTRPSVAPATERAEARYPASRSSRWCGSRVRPGGVIRFVNLTGIERGEYIERKIMRLKNFSAKTRNQLYSAESPSVHR
jgi:hypothetical protein